MEVLTNKNNKIPNFIGESNFAREMRNLISSVSSDCASILLAGEKGTGKKLFSQNVHLATEKNLHNFVEINCKAFDSQIIKEIFNSYYFIENKETRITLFVNFIEDLDFECQQLLFNLINSFKQKQLNIKIISSTQISPETLKEKINKELFFSISTIVLNFIPLRNRKEDIIPISNYYVEKFNRGSGLRLSGFTQNAIEALQNNFWCGNADELINCIQHAFIVCSNKIIDCSDLNLEQNDFMNTEQTLKTAVDSFKHDFVKAVLQANGWNQTKTAKVLGIQRTYVIRLMNELQIRK